MKNVTVTLDEGLAHWARVEAAKAGKSLSRYISDTLAAGRNRQVSQSEALERLLAMPPLNLLDDPSRPLRREDIYAEREADLLRRYQRADLSRGSSRDGEA